MRGGVLTPSFFGPLNDRQLETMESFLARFQGMVVVVEEGDMIL